MHLLFATSIVPDGKLGSGYEIANAAIIAALRRTGARVSVMGFSWPGSQPSDPADTIVLGEVDVRTEGAPLHRKLGWLAAAMRAGLTVSSVKLRVVAPQQVREAIERHGPFDGYVLNSVQFAGAFEEVFAGRPFVFVAHNVEHRSAEENAGAADNAVQRYLYTREAALLRSIENRLCRDARFVFTLAEEDRRALNVASANRSAALPLVTMAEAPPFRAVRRKTCDAGLIGTWTWQPNRIGLDWFLKSVVPHLRPDFRIRIAGQVPAGMGSDHPGVTFVGRVPNAVEFIRGAAVVPLISTAGSGVQLKTIETFELGLPSVATSRSLRGIDHVPANCIVRDDPVDFAREMEHAVDGRFADLDGADFHHRQRAALDAGVRRGLEIAAFSRREAAA